MRKLIAFATATSTPTYDHPKAGRLLSGNPLRTTWEHYGNPSGEISSGVWACEIGAWRIVFDEHSDEYFHVLEGRIRITDSDGHTSEFGPGDACIIPAGFSGTFEVLQTVRKHYVMIKRQP